MGGYGSGRWYWHTKKNTVEQSLRLRISNLKPYLRAGIAGWSKWTRGEQKTDSINWQVIGNVNRLTSIRLFYTQTNNQISEKTDLDYRILLTTTRTPWGSLRYWFVCPLTKNGQLCGRRVGVLYLPPGGRWFGCRHCYELTYESCQEEHKFDYLNAHFAVMLQDVYPGITPRFAGELMERLLEREMRISPKLDRFLREKAMRGYPYSPDPYAGYLTDSELCAQSDLTPANLAALEGARLLLPDRPSGLYRPKLVGWARKLAYLISEGWQLEEIRAWSRGRWSTSNPREFPPERAKWYIP